MHFRQPPADFPPADGEALAIKELASRAERLRRSILLPTIVAGVVAGVTGYLFVRGLQFMLWNAQVPWISGIVGVLPPFVGSLHLARFLSDAAVARRVPGWIEEQAKLHQLEPSVLEQYRAVL